MKIHLPNYSQSLHHIEESGQALSEIRRVLKQGGFLAVSEPCRNNRFWRSLGRMSAKSSQMFLEYHHTFNSKELKELLEDAGFEVIVQKAFGNVGFPVNVFGARVPVLRKLYWQGRVARMLVRMDKTLTKCPLTRAFSWHNILIAKKKGE